MIEYRAHQQVNHRLGSCECAALVSHVSRPMMTNGRIISPIVQFQSVHQSSESMAVHPIQAK